MTITSSTPFLILSTEEAKELQRFFFSAGYISYEEFESIHSLARKVDKYLEDITHNEQTDNKLPEGGID